MVLASAEDEESLSSLMWWFSNTQRGPAAVELLGFHVDGALDESNYRGWLGFNVAGVLDEIDRWIHG